MHKNKKTNIAIVIAVYKWAGALNLVLKSIENQSIPPDEIIVADDGSGSDVKKLINSFKRNSPLKLKHIWQKNMGFRKPM